MNYFNAGVPGLAYGWHIHGFFGLMSLIGAILLIILAVRTMDKKELRTWTIWLIAIGIIGTILTSSWGFYGSSELFGGMMGKQGYMQNVNWQQMMGDINDDDQSSLDTNDKWNDYMRGKMRDNTFAR